SPDIKPSAALGEVPLRARETRVRLPPPPRVLKVRREHCWRCLHAPEGRNEREARGRSRRRPLPTATSRRRSVSPQPAALPRALLESWFTRPVDVERPPSIRSGAAR